MADAAQFYPGDSAPDFTLMNQINEPKSLTDFRGQYLVVYFYPKDDTPGCTKEACGFRDLAAEFNQAESAIVGVSPDNDQSHQEFITKYGLTFELLSDPEKSMMTQYGAWGEKNMYGKLSTGVIRSTVLIDPAGKVVKHWRKVTKADQHPAKVLEALSAAKS